MRECECECEIVSEIVREGVRLDYLAGAHTRALAVLRAWRRTTARASLAILAKMAVSAAALQPVNAQVLVEVILDFGLLSGQLVTHRLVSSHLFFHQNSTCSSESSMSEWQSWSFPTHKPSLISSSRVSLSHRQI